MIRYVNDNHPGSIACIIRKKYFYSSLMIILSFFFNTNNVFLSGFFNSFIKLILFCSVINSIVLILSIIFADRSIKSLKPDADWMNCE